MSTFDGKVEEFPDIRIDYFRSSTSDSTPPLAYFLSHVHSDHLRGLESCKSPFIYCSPATRDILLKLEKYPHRMNFAKGILETRKQSYRHLKNLLKAIPLETPTEIELHPGKQIRVTLFCANHCIGAVMFLIQGGGKGVLYTGDVRSEPWWVNTLTRHPVILPYVCSSGSESNGNLDNIYLDTTFVVTGPEDQYTEFTSKADGLSELLQKVAQYPADTLFYLDTWTFGYEDVYQALASLLGSQIHVDEYRYGVYRALANGVEPRASDAAKFTGFYCGNHYQQGCLSEKSDECRIHSCEKGTGCEIWSKDFVRITPIVSRYNGTEIAEAGAGGGQGDLSEQHELDTSDPELLRQLMALCKSKLEGQPQLLSKMLAMLTSALDNSRQSIKLDNRLIQAAISTDEDTQLDGMGDLPLEKLVSALAHGVTKASQKQARSGFQIKGRASAQGVKREDGLPKAITFAYSRHSSYNELCQLIEAFKPKNIHPCTVDEANWTASSSMSSLFGHIYTAPLFFKHDQVMLKKTGCTAKKIQHNSRPVTSGSSSSDYATPKAYASVPNVDHTMKSTTNSLLVSTQGRHSEDNETPFRRASKHGRQKQGGFWRSRGIDHYSPPPRAKRRASSPIVPSGLIDKKGPIERPDLMLTDNISGDRLENPSRKRIAETMPSESSSQEADSGRGRSRIRESLKYGRLSPRPVPMKYESDEIDIYEHVDKKRHKSTEAWQSSKSSNHGSPELPTLSSPAQDRLAFRHEAHDAVLGKDGASWSEIGLVSVKGHQVKEEEL